MDKNQSTQRAAETTRTAVPAAVIKRLPRYHRFLGELLREGRGRISSAELSKIMGVTASQIRQDLNCFGGFGQQGYGYNIEYLYGKISELLGVNEAYRAVIVGAGNLGKALAASHMFERRGVKKLALFDVDKSIIGTKIYGLPVYSIDDLHDFCTENSVDIGVLTVFFQHPGNVFRIVCQLTTSCYFIFALLFTLTPQNPGDNKEGNQANNQCHNRGQNECGP